MPGTIATCLEKPLANADSEHLILEFSKADPELKAELTQARLK
jgi:hypothetical protein